MPRIALVLFKYFPYGGLQRDFMGVAMAALARGFSVDVYTMSWEGPRPADLNIIIIPPKGLTNHRRYYHFIKMLAEYRQKQAYQAVIGFNKMPHLDFYYAADLCFAVKCKPWQRYIPRYRWLIDSEANVFTRDKATIILALSAVQMSAFQQSYLTPTQRFHILPPWLDVEHFRKPDRDLCRQMFARELGIPENTKWILHVGSGFRTKGVDRSLKALAALPSGLRQSYSLIVVGKDYARPFQCLAKTLGITSQVYFMGGRSDVAEWMKAADLLLHPAYAENAGIVLFEAIAAGLPILTTAVCGYAEHVSRAHAGMVLAEPFCQEKLNQTLADWLVHGMPPSRAAEYLAGLNLSAMPDVVMGLVETYINRPHVAAPQLTPMTTADGWVLSAIVAERPEILCKKKSELQFNWSKVFELPGKMARKMPERETLRLELQHGNYFIKRFLPIPYLKSLWKRCFDLKEVGVLPEYIAVNRLHALAVPTLEVAGFGMEATLPHSSFLMTHEIQGINLEDYSRDWLKTAPSRTTKLAVVTQLAATLRVIHHYGMNHRDCYLCHFWIDPQQVPEQGNIDNLALVVMDLHRAQIRPRVPTRWKIKDLGGLLYSAWQIPLTARDLCRFVEAYTGKSWRQAYEEHPRFWRAVLKKAIRVRMREHRLGLLTPDNQWLKALLV
jgi:UDP-glucose:(heptosyl)LPS alpha-1,3-glucosyltransferase